MLKRKEKRNSYSFRIVTTLFSLAFALFIWQEQSIAVFARGEAAVVEESGNIREVASAQGGGNKTTVGSGGNLTTVGGGNSSAGAAAGNEGTNEAGSQEGTTEGVAQSQVLTARVKEKVRVRKGAGTTYDIVTSAEANTQVSVSGEARDGEDMLWYQISYNEADKTVNGFIREDYLEVVETAQAPEPAEEEPVTEPQGEPAPANEDYNLKYMENENGEWDWYLFDNIQGKSWSLTQILTAVTQIQENQQTENKQLSTMKIIVIAMAVVLVLLVVTVTILLFKLRDSYEEYEDEEEDEDEYETEIEEEEDEEEEVPVRTSKARLGRKRAVRSVSVEEEEEEPVRATVKTSSKTGTRSRLEENKSWQSKDFLELDDDMEFEFLDL